MPVLWYQLPRVPTKASPATEQSSLIDFTMLRTSWSFQMSTQEDQSKFYRSSWSPICHAPLLALFCCVCGVAAPGNMLHVKSPRHHDSHASCSTEAICGYDSYMATAMSLSPVLSTAWARSYKEDAHRLSFLDLPGELRNLIHDYRFHVPGAIMVFDRSPLESERVFAAKIVRYKNHGALEPQSVYRHVSTGLLQTC
ncbi:hypothetical protein ST47_g2401 [Ascochyta rabiei]|uniref:Uncharacterized protein n=1 Tax=Didymella rabiei TaxID=5454 RepID=A0A163JPC0_DIDRA|nr:hypothetical protein ST47_g2401 [Ascochyta rabiei]